MQKAEWERRRQEYKNGISNIQHGISNVQVNSPKTGRQESVDSSKKIKVGNREYRNTGIQLNHETHESNTENEEI